MFLKGGHNETRSSNNIHAFAGFGFCSFGITQ